MSTPECPDATGPTWDSPTILSGSWLVLSDLHVPHHDRRFLELCAGLAVRWGVHGVVLNGDLAEFAGASAKFRSKPDPSLEEEWAVCRDVTGWLESLFAHLVFLPGNHESRLITLTGGEVSVDTLTRLVLNRPESWVVTPYAYVVVASNPTDWSVEHPRGTSTIPGRYAQRRTGVSGVNVVAAHGHTAGASRSESGLWAVDSGGCFDPARLGYVARVPGTRPVMAQGAVLLVGRDGGHHPYCLRPDTDWSCVARTYREGELEVARLVRRSTP